jgi:hypothetical protein
MSKSKTLVGIIKKTKADTDNTIAALSLQARAWRICAIKATADPEAGKRDAQGLFLHTVPFVDGEFVTRYIDNNEAVAEAAGKASGVFAP